MMTNLERGFKAASFAGIVEIMPILQHLPFGPMKELKDLQQFGRSFMTDLIKDASINYAPGDPNNFIDMYRDNRLNLEQALQQIHSAEMLDDADLARTVGDLFAAGTETSSTTLKWMLLYMMVYPNIQEKVP